MSCFAKSAREGYAGVGLDTQVIVSITCHRRMHQSSPAESQSVSIDPNSKQPSAKTFSGMYYYP